MSHFRRQAQRLAGVVAMICFYSGVQAQPRNYSLAELIDSAQKNLPVLLEKEALINASQAQLTDTKHSFLPRMRLAEQINIGSDNSLAGPYFSYGIIPSVSAGVRADNKLEAATGNMGILYSEYELYNFGLNKARIENAQSLIELRKAEKDQLSYNVTYALAKLYFNLQRSLHQLSFDRQNVQRYEQIYSVIQALTISGIRPGSDSLLAGAELARARINVDLAIGKVNEWKEKISFYTGIAANRLDMTANLDVFQKQSFFTGSTVIDSLYNPLLLVNTRYSQWLHSNNKVIQKTFLPRIMLTGATWVRGSSIGFGDQYKSLSTGLGYQRFNYALGVGVVYDLFNGIYRKDKLRINHYLEKAGEASWQQQYQSLQSASRQADQLLAATQAGLDQMPGLLQAANATYQQKLAQYRAGIIALVDLTNSAFVLYRSQTDYIQMLTDWYTTQLDKSAATGQLNNYISTIK